MIHLKKQKLDLWRVLQMKNKDSFDVLNPFNGEVVDSVNNLSRVQVHSLINDSLNFHCNLTSKQRSEILLKTADYLKQNTNSFVTNNII